jgi:esterase/lipase superfamily enzyme
MDRQIFGALCVAALLLAGCKGENQEGSSTPVTSSSSSAAAPHVVERPPTTIVETSPPLTSSDSLDPIGSGFPAAAEPNFAPSEAITPLSSTTDDHNPLRLATEPEAFAPEPQFAPAPQAENPLRSFAPSGEFSPRMAIRSSDWPAGGSAAPEGVPFAPESAAPEPSFAAAPPPEESPPSAALPMAAAPPEHFDSAAMPPAEPAAAEPPSRDMQFIARAAGPDESAAAEAPQPYDIVQVFYGTDREAIEPVAVDLPAQISRYVPVLASILVTLCLCLIALAKRRASLWALAGCGVVATFVLGLQAASGTLTDVRRTEHEGPRYTSNRAPDGRVQVGICEVAIPKIHVPGELESPSILRAEVKDDAAKHVVLAKTRRLGNEQFYETLRQRVAQSPRKEVFIFIHGFNVNFEDAARRTAQIHKDLKFEGAPVFFSWPAHDKFILTYLADANNIPWTVPHLKQFLLEVVQESQAKSINLIAHSMGNRALAATLRELELEFKDDARFFNQVVLAAPDIDSDEFRTVIAPHMQKTANHFTLYASARDEALAASQLAHFGPRAGDAGHGLVVVPGIDTIDVTAIDTSPWGHTYYGSSDPVLRDLGLVLMQGVLPPHRGWLVPAEASGMPYWVFQPQTTAGRSSFSLPR